MDQDQNKEEESYSVEAEENMKTAVENFKESLLPIGSQEANKNVFFGIRVSMGGVRRRLVDLGTIDAPEGPLQIELMIFNKEHIPEIMEQLKGEGYKPRTELGTQYIKVDVPPPTKLQLMDIASDVERRTKSALGNLNKIKGNTSVRVQRGLENEYIDQRAAGKANKNLNKHLIKYDKEITKLGILKRYEILGKHFSPIDDEEKKIFKSIKDKEKTKDNE